VVTDVDGSWDQTALQVLKAIQGTIRTRILY